MRWPSGRVTMCSWLEKERSVSDKGVLGSLVHEPSLANGPDSSHAIGVPATLSLMVGASDQLPGLGHTWT